MKRIFFAGVLCLLLSACAVTTKLTEESESNIRTVSFDTKVKVENPTLIGPTPMLGAIGGAIAGAVAYKRGQQLAEYMRQNEIDIGEIVLKEFEKQVKEHPRFANKRFIKDTDKADAKFEFEIVGYGLGVKHGLSSQYRPLLSLRARLVSHAGKKLWERYDYITGIGSSTPSYTLQEYFGYSGNMREAYEEVAKQVVSLLMKNLGE